MKLRPKQRRKEAEARQAASDLLSAEERLAKLDVNGHRAIRERVRLGALLIIERHEGEKSASKKQKKTKKKKRGA